MGFSITWCAVPESAADEFISHLNLTDTGRTEEFPESLIGMARLDTGWRLIWYNKYDCPFLSEEKRAEYSLGYDILHCLVEEHLMASSSEFWSLGVRKWHISHEGIDGPKGLDSSGELPDGFQKIKSEMEENQEKENEGEAEVDFIFEIPLLVAQSITGFKHDEVCQHVIGDEYHIMKRTSESPSFLSRLFRKKTK